MKLICTQEDLSKGLAIAGRALSNRSTLPILSCIHLSAGESSIALRSTNLEMGIICEVPATIEDAGSVALPAGLLTDLVKNLPAGQVTLSMEDESQTMLITGQRSKARLRGHDPAEFPTLERPRAHGPGYHFEATALKEAITQVAFAAASDDSRPVLTGVLVRCQGDRVILAAADAFRLAVREVSLLGAEGRADASEDEEETLLENLLIPARTLTELARILPNEGEVFLSLNQSSHQVCFQTEHLTVISRLIEGTFPNYTQIIPSMHTTRVVLETAALRAAVRTVSLFARTNANITCLSIQPGTDETPGALTLEANAEDVGDTVSTLEASVEGEEMSLLFNTTYLHDMLAALHTPEVALEGLGAATPGVFRPVGMSGTLYVVMPMHLNR